MACASRCGKRAPSALAKYSKSLREAQADENPQPQYPMFTLPLEEVFHMKELRNHQELREAGLLIKYEQPLGKAMFVSHQWVSGSGNGRFVGFVVLSPPLLWESDLVGT